MSKRKALGPKVRFAVFERDGFVCTYCGGTPPNVVLHVDHYMPVSAGGSNDMENLFTACSSCNMGKSDSIPISDHPSQSKDTPDLMREKAAQARAYHDYQMARIQIESEQLDDFYRHWCSLFKGTENGTGYHCEIHFPFKTVLQKYLKTLGIQALRDAATITSERKYSESGPLMARYFSGILKNWQAKKDGEVKA